MTREYDSRTYPATPITPPSPTVEGDDETQTADEGDSLPTIEELTYEHLDAHDKLKAVVENETSRTLLQLLVDYDGSGVSYDMVLDYVDVSRKTVRRRTSDLRDAGIVEVVDTGIVLVGFVEEAYIYLASDVLNAYYKERLS